MRGQRIFNEILRVEGCPPGERKGRSDVLLGKRNNCMLARYYYYGYLRNKSYEDIISLIVGEFFLSPDRIARIIQQNISFIKELKERKFSLNQLQNTWPHFKWG